jgi:hypothetical protein
MGHASNSGGAAAGCDSSALGSPFIPVEGWIYPAVLRLYSLGFLNNVYLGIRPWARASLSHMLEDTGDTIADAEQRPATDEARNTYETLDRELRLDASATCVAHVGKARLESTYTVARAISDTPLRDSFHLGATIVNGYGRPYENGFNNYSSVSAYAIADRFTVYLRGGFQGAPSAAGYSSALFQKLAMVGLTTNPITSLAYANQATIPAGHITTAPEGKGLSQPPVSGEVEPLDCDVSSFGSPFIPVDSWIYPAMLRLYSLGYVDDLYLGMRPWTHSMVSEMLDEAADRIGDAEANGEVDAAEESAQSIYSVVRHQLHQDASDPCGALEDDTRIESAYSWVRTISGTPLRDSFHLGSMIVNDYGRTYENGFNNYTGISGYASRGRYVFYARGELQGAPSAAGYSAAFAQALSTVDGTTYATPASTPYSQATIPQGPIASVVQGHVLEAYVSAQVLNHVISFGKQDEWLGPAQGGSMAYSNNADGVYALHIDRIEPLYIPLLSRVTGPFRYEFLLGALRGHTLMPNPLYQANPSIDQPNVINPGDPWVHIEKVSFRPTVNLEFGFERTVLWGGEGHSPVTIGTFLRSFFSTSSPGLQKNGRDDAGARFASFDFSYRLPFLRSWLTLYSDSEVHDDVSPIDAPRRAAIRPGLYLSRVPGLLKLDVRAEAASTDPPSSTGSARQYGRFMYWEEIERQGYTNEGHLFGDWIGREDKGGQAWVTYHLSGDEWVQVSVRNQKATKDFIPGSTTQTISGTTTLIPGGTTLNDIAVQIEKRIGKNIAITGAFSLEHWKAPIYLPGQQTVTTTNVQVTWYPQRKIRF